MKFDISELLTSWEYQPGQVLVRRFIAEDGEEKIQLRVDLGVLQFNAHGRPDGRRPYGHDSLLEVYEARLEKHIQQHGDDEDFFLNEEDCAKLQQEVIQFHHRYICLFQLEDYEGVIQDGERNLEVFDLVDQYAETDELAWFLQQLRPQPMMMVARARATLALKEDKWDEAIEIVEIALEDLKNFFLEQEKTELIENCSEILSLESWLEELRERRNQSVPSQPMSEKEKLRLEMDEAVAREDYEKAAECRDAIRKLENHA